MKAPLTFFDVTPVGRILSRFSEDIETVDDEIPWLISEVWACFFEVTNSKKLLSFRVFFVSF